MTKFFYAFVMCMMFINANAFSMRRTDKSSTENKLLQKGYEYIIGTDEVGRGAIAGPVLATSCCIYLNFFSSESIGFIPGVQDSKLLSDTQRREIYQQIVKKPSIYRWKSVQRSPKEIEESNVFKATMSCFQESIQNLILCEKIPLDLVYSIVDGKSTPKLVNGPTPIPCRPMVNADKKVYTVSLASIISKCERDQLMIEAHKKYPEYNFHINKGYRTRDHVERIHKHGPCPLHRMSFKALKHR